MKRHAPDLLDARFARDVNAKLGSGVRIDLFSIEEDDGRREYKLLMAYCGHRRTITSDSPFSFAGETEIINRVHHWIAMLDNPNSKWSDDPRYA